MRHKSVSASDALRSEDWDALGRRVVANLSYAARRRGIDPRNLGDGVSVEDIAHVAVRKVIEAAEEDSPARWVPEKGPLEPFLSTIAHHELDRHLGKLARRRPKESAEEPLVDSYEETVVSAERARESNEEKRKFLQRIGVVPELNAIVNAVRNGAGHKPKSIVAATGLRIERVYAAMRRMRRIATQVRGLRKEVL